MKDLKFDENGLMTAVVQDANSKQVLMVAMMDYEAIMLTIKSKQAHFWSRSRKQLWHKGETSGNFLDVKEILFDCDKDAILLLVEPFGPACHTGSTSCFFEQLEQ